MVDFESTDKLENDKGRMQFVVTKTLLKHFCKSVIK